MQHFINKIKKYCSWSKIHEHQKKHIYNTLIDKSSFIIAPLEKDIHFCIYIDFIIRHWKTVFEITEELDDDYKQRYKIIYKYPKTFQHFVFFTWIYSANNGEDYFLTDTLRLEIRKKDKVYHYYPVNSDRKIVLPNFNPENYEFLNLILCCQDYVLTLKHNRRNDIYSNQNLLEEFIKEMILKYKTLE